MTRRKSPSLDKRHARPRSIDAKRALVREIYRDNGWHKYEHKANVEMLNLPLKAIDDYRETELDFILADFEKRGMVLFQKAE